MRNQTGERLRSACKVSVLIILGACWLWPGIGWELLPPSRAAEQRQGGDLDRLLRARYEAGLHVLQMEQTRLNKGVTTLSRVCEVARWVRDSAVELPGPAAERLAALTNYVTLTRQLEESMARAVAVGAAATVDSESARYLRLDAEVALLRARHQAED